MDMINHHYAPNHGDTVEDELVYEILGVLYQLWSNICFSSWDVICLFSCSQAHCSAWMQTNKFKHHEFLLGLI